jgi:hypothetical protein
MTICNICRRPFERDAGPLIPTCTPCMERRAITRQPHIERNGLLIPNPDWVNEQLARQTNFE